MGASSPPSASAAAEGKQLTQQQEKKAAVMTPQQRASCRQLSVAFFLQCVSHNLVSYPRASLTLIFNGGDSAAAARVIALMATSGSMVEFVFGPCFGRLSDRYGRLLFLLVGPLGTVIFDGLVFLFPSQPVLILGKIVSTLTVTAFVTILRSALNDVVQGEAYAVANSSSAHAPLAGVPAHNRPMHPPPCLILVVHGSGPHFPLLWPRNSLTAVALVSMLPPLPVYSGHLDWQRHRHQPHHRVALRLRAGGLWPLGSRLSAERSFATHLLQGDTAPLGASARRLAAVQSPLVHQALLALAHDDAAGDRHLLPDAGRDTLHDGPGDGDLALRPRESHATMVAHAPFRTPRIRQAFVRAWLERLRRGA
jgi:MFS family permease